MEITLRRPPKEKGDEAPRDYSPWDESKYRVQFLSLEEIDDQWGGLYVEVKAIGGDYDGQTRRLRVFPDSEAIRTLVALTGEDSEAETASFDPEVLVGKEANVYITHKTKGDQTYMNVKKFGAARKATK